MQSVRRSKLIVATIAAMVTVLLLWLWATHLPMAGTLLAAGVSLVVAVIWGVQYAVVTGRLIVGQHRRVSLPGLAEIKGKLRGLADSVVLKPGDGDASPADSAETTDDEPADEMRNPG